MEGSKPTSNWFKRKSNWSRSHSKIWLTENLTSSLLRIRQFITFSSWCSCATALRLSTFLRSIGCLTRGRWRKGRVCGSGRAKMLSRWRLPCSGSVTLTWPRPVMEPQSISYFGWRVLRWRLMLKLISDSRGTISGSRCRSVSGCQMHMTMRTSWSRLIVRVWLLGWCDGSCILDWDRKICIGISYHHNCASNPH